MVAGDPVEAAGRDEHDATAAWQRELQRLGNAVLRFLTHRVEAEPIPVERERGTAIGDRQADDDGCVVHAPKDRRRP